MLRRLEAVAVKPIDVERKNERRRSLCCLYECQSLWALSLDGDSVLLPRDMTQDGSFS